ncbi:SPAC11D3.06 [Scenedesmus sp. PABB004]|nr:SPAC11D3.06 [Scenedesmus sp. PABB004]
MAAAAAGRCLPARMQAPAPAPSRLAAVARPPARSSGSSSSSGGSSRRRPQPARRRLRAAPDDGGEGGTSLLSRARSAPRAPAARRRCRSLSAAPAAARRAAAAAGGEPASSTGRDAAGGLQGALGDMGFKAFVSEDEWRKIDKKVNKYPGQRTFTAIGTGGADFRAAMLAAVEGVVGTVHCECVSERPSSGGKYVSLPACAARTTLHMAPAHPRSPEDAAGAHGGSGAAPAAWRPEPGSPRAALPDAGLVVSGSPDATVVVASSDDGGSPLSVPLLASGKRRSESFTTPLARGCSSLGRELQAVLLLAMPTVVTTAAQQVIIVTSQMFSGHIGTDEMAAAALSNTWWNLMWYTLLGVSTALDTLGSQAVGAGDRGGLVCWALSAAFVLTALNVPMGLAMWYGGEVAELFFGQGPEVAALVSKFCRWLLPGLWPMSMAQLLQKYLQTQGIVGPPAIASGLSIAVNVAASIAGTELLGLRGVAFAATGTRVALLVMMLVVVAVAERAPGRLCCAWWSGDAWRTLAQRARQAARADVTWTFLALGVPGGIMMGLECASFEVTTAFSGFLGPADVAAHAGVFAITSLCYIAMPFALATAGTIRVGNLLGAGLPGAARTSSRVIVSLGVSFMALCGAAIYAFRYELGDLFTSGDAEVLQLVARIAPLGAAYQVGDGVLGTSQGVLRGLGRQAQLMLLNTCCFWVVGVPLGWWLTFRGPRLGLPGLWFGMATGCFLAAGVSLALMLCVDWRKEARATHEALEEHSPDHGVAPAPEEEEVLLVLDPNQLA